MINFNKSTLNLSSSLTDIISNIFSLKNLTNDYNSSESLEYCFKVLVFDDKVFSIISSLIKVYSLRENNICLNINIKDRKDKMPNVMGIYIIAATEENFNFLKDDIQRQIFDNFYINLISYDSSNQTNQNQLTKFFNEISNFTNLSSISNITILPLDILLYHERMFSLDIKKPYLFLNSPNISDDEYMEYISKISNGLFSTLFILKTIPIIRFRTGYFVEDIIKKLQSNFNYLFDKYPEKKDEFILKKKDAHTLLIILDRDTDLPIMLHHASSYGSMTNEIVGLSRGDQIQEFKKGENIQRFVVDPINDYLWNEYLTEPFFNVGKIIYDEYQKYQKDTGFLDKVDKPKDMESLLKESEKLSKSIEKLRDHKLLSNILTQESNSFNKMVKEATQREIGKFYEIEDAFLRKRNNLSNEGKKKVFAYLKQMKLENNTIDDKNKINDIYRLALIYYLCSNSNSNTPQEINEMANKLPNQNALKYLKNKKEQNNSGNSNKNEHNTYWQHGLNFVMNSLNSLMSVEQPSISADIVNSLFFNKKVDGFTTYNMFKKAYEKEGNFGNYTFSDVIVFVVGGGSFGEFEYIDDLIKKNDIKTIYGCDYIYKPDEFLDDLEKLGKITENM